MSESRLARWSRRKSEARNEGELAPPSTGKPEPAPAEQELALNEALPEREVLKKYDLPDPSAIELGTDITGFMRKEIPELLRRKALRSLWRSNPVLAVLDGLNDYDGDFTDAGLGVKGAKTLYKVGQGLIDRNARPKEDNDKLADADGRKIGEEKVGEDQTGMVGKIVEDQVAVQTAPPVALETIAPTHQPGSVTAEAEAEAERAPRHRPRMRFND